MNYQDLTDITIQNFTNGIQHYEVKEVATNEIIQKLSVTVKEDSTEEERAVLISNDYCSWIRGHGKTILKDYYNNKEIYLD